MGTDRKISELASLTGAAAADGDLVHVVDISEAAAVDKNKSMTMAELENKILPAIAAYTPSFSAGWGTMASSQYLYSAHNGVMTIWGEQTNGVVSGVALTIGLPSGYQISTAATNTLFLGLFQRNALTTARYGIIATGGDTHIGISRLDTGTGAYVEMLGTGGMGSSEKQSLFCQFPVEVV